MIYKEKYVLSSLFPYQPILHYLEGKGEEESELS